MNDYLQQLLGSREYRENLRKLDARKKASRTKTRGITYHEFSSSAIKQLKSATRKEIAEKAIEVAAISLNLINSKSLEDDFELISSLLDSVITLTESRSCYLDRRLHRSR